ncbi:hypothetical protein [Janthinobacterium sp. 17J80-10]|uniref:hypothetical protein n=1 Tax=Janthinobacterium sp. 17J80-10 TaxID=2497863 RepID=UPI0013E8E5C2|nr:hypothetical protein [Janthinobacterium sp. 17J80-10]
MAKLDAQGNPINVMSAAGKAVRNALNTGTAHSISPRCMARNIAIFGRADAAQASSRRQA